jgi:ribosomal protein L37AE/L43A
MATNLVLVPCKLCKTKVPVSDLRKNKDGLYVCNTCLSHGFYETSLRVNELRKPLPSNVQPQVKKEEKIAYLCNSCKFSFTKPLGSEDKNCPMCGKDFSVVRKQGASELLRDVEDMME